MARRRWDFLNELNLMEIMKNYFSTVIKQCINPVIIQYRCFYFKREIVLIKFCRGAIILGRSAFFSYVHTTPFVVFILLIYMLYIHVIRWKTVFFLCFYRNLHNRRRILWKTFCHAKIKNRVSCAMRATNCQMLPCICSASPYEFCTSDPM